MRFFLSLFLLAAMSGNVIAAPTATPTPTATATNTATPMVVATPALVSSLQQEVKVAFVFSCTLDFPSLATGTRGIVNCGAPGILTTDLVVPVVPQDYTNTGVVVSNISPTAYDSVIFTLSNTTAGTVNVGDTTIQFLVFRKIPD